MIKRRRLTGPVVIMLWQSVRIGGRMHHGAATRKGQSVTVITELGTKVPNRTRPITRTPPPSRSAARDLEVGLTHRVLSCVRTLAGVLSLIVQG